MKKIWIKRRNNDFLRGQFMKKNSFNKIKVILPSL